MSFLPHPPRNHPAPPAKLVTVTLTVVFLYLLATYKILGQQAFPLAIRIHDGMAIQLASVNFCFRVAIYTSVLASNSGKLYIQDFVSGAALIVLQSCETKSGTESLDFEGQ